MNVKNSKPNNDRFLNDALNPQANNQLQIVKCTRDCHRHGFFKINVDKKKNLILANTDGTNIMETTSLEEPTFRYSMLGFQ